MIETAFGTHATTTDNDQGIATGPASGELSQGANSRLVISAGGDARGVGVRQDLTSVSDGVGDRT